jgi:transcriptional regulator with XRE-family HTH domain
MDRSYYDDLERGIKDPTLTYLDKLAGALNLTADELIKDDVSKEAGDDVLVQHSMDAPRDLVRAGISFDRVLLERIDQRATSMGLTRTAFVVNAVAEKLLQLERVEK